jgi:hypothetical protein
MNFIKNIFRGLKRERELIGKFREAGAYTFDLSIDPKEIGDINISLLNKLIRKRVLERAEGSKLFLNDRELLKYRMEKSKWGMIFLLFILGVIILFFR